MYWANGTARQQYVVRLIRRTFSGSPNVMPVYQSAAKYLAINSHVQNNWRKVVLRKHVKNNWKKIVLRRPDD